MPKPAAETLRLDLRFRRGPCPELFDYLHQVPGAQRAETVRHLAYLGWLVQRGTLPLPGPASRAGAAGLVDTPTPAPANPDPLELDLLRVLDG